MVSLFASESTPLLKPAPVASSASASSILHSPDHQQQQQHHVVIVVNNNNKNGSNDCDDLDLSSPSKKQQNGATGVLLDDSSRRSRLSTSFRDWSQRVRIVVGQHTGTELLCYRLQCCWLTVAYCSIIVELAIWTHSNSLSRSHSFHL